MQTLVNGLIEGAVLALLAAAFQLVYLPTRILHFSLAGLYTISPYVLATFLSILGVIPAFLATALSLAVSGLAIEVLNHAPLSRRRASEGAHFVSSLGITMILIQVVALTWGVGARRLSDRLEASYQVGPLFLTESQCIAAAGATAILMCLVWFVLRTSFGLRLRAMADNCEQFSLYGHNAKTYRLIGFGLSGLLCSSASILSAIQFGYSAMHGIEAVMLALVAVLLGGRATFLGAVCGAILLGVIRSEVSWYISTRWADLAVFCTLIFVLFVRPQGLLSKKGRIEAVT